MNPLLETGTSLTVELARYRRMLSRAWLPTALFGLAGLAGGLVMTMQIPPSFQATAGVFAPGTPTYLAPDVEPSPTESPPDPREWTQDTEAELVHSAVVLRAAAGRLRNGMTPDELSDRIQISVPTSTRVFSLTFTADSPAAAQRGAQVVAEEYVRHRSTLLGDRARRIGDALRERRTSLETLLSDAPDDVDEAPAGGNATSFPVNLTLRAEIRAQIARIDELLSTAGNTGANRAELVSRPERPTRSARANAQVAPVSGLLVGLLAGFGLGFLHDRRQPLVCDADELSELTGLPVATTVAGPSGDPRLVRLAADLHDVTEPAGEVVVTGWTAAQTLEAYATGLQAAYAGAERGSQEAESAVTVRAVRPGSVGMVRHARTADVVLLLAEVGATSRPDLMRVARLLRRSPARVAVVAVDLGSVPADVEAASATGTTGGSAP
jgi:hypothetical protein